MCSLSDASGRAKREEGKHLFANLSKGALTQKGTLGEAAHFRSVIFVSLRMAASAVTPSSPMSLPQIAGKSSLPPFETCTVSRLALSERCQRCLWATLPLRAASSFVGRNDEQKEQA